MDRETKELVINLNHVFIVKSYATAREAQAIQQALFKGSKVEMVGDQPKISEFNMGAQFEQEQELIHQMVISMNGTSENIVERCLELPSDEFAELTKALDEIVSKKKS